MKELLERLEALDESRAYDSKFLIRKFAKSSDDEEPKIARLFQWMSDRLNQTHPDSDVKISDLFTILGEPGTKSVLRKSGLSFKEAAREVKAFWMNP